MGSLFSGTSVSGYNANPPPDDGSTGANNLITWAGIKSKVGDPLNTFAGSISTALVTSFQKLLDGAGVVSTGVNYAMTAADQGRLIVATAAITITTPDAGTVTAPFLFAINNRSGVSITLAGNATNAQTVDGATTQTIAPGGGAIVKTDGTNWFTYGLAPAQTGAGVVGEPLGYLTLSSSTSEPILSGDVTAATSVYYTPFRGNLAWIYNGSNFIAQSFAQLTLSLTASHIASSIYDVFLFLNSGVVTIGTGPAWSNSSAGAGARGSGGGTTELQRLSGLWTNKNIITLNNGASSFSNIPANQALYVGSIFIDGTNGQISCHVSYGQSRKWGVWNAYSRMPLVLQAGDSTASWSYTTASVRPSNNNSANSLTLFTGLPEEIANIEFNQRATVNNTAAGGGITLAIGYNSTSAFSGINGNVTASNSNASNVTSGGTVLSQFNPNPPGLGIQTVTSLEQATSTNGATVFGTISNMLLRAMWRG